MQKLIETMKTRQEISLIIQALEPGFLDLATDLNGNHVLQRCLQCLSKEHNKVYDILRNKQPIQSNTCKYDQVVHDK